MKYSVMVKKEEFIVPIFRSRKFAKFQTFCPALKMGSDAAP